MCLILFGYHTDAQLPLIVAANRDEFHPRASAQADFWEDFPHVLAGRDLVAGGTWLGCTVQGRFAALTNFSSPTDPPAPKSRGLLVQDFLTGRDSAGDYAERIHGPDYAGFNLLLYDTEQMVYASNKGTTQFLQPGFYGLSNAELAAPWPKCVQGAQDLAQMTRDQFTHSQLIARLRNSDIPADDALPVRGRPVEFERRVAPTFIVGDDYGTRASTALVVTPSAVSFVEQSYAPGGVANGMAEFSVSRQND